MTLRSRVAPGFALVDNPIFLATLYERLGALIYAADWKSRFIDITGASIDPIVGSNEYLADFVGGQIIEGISGKKVQVQGKIDTRAFQRKRVSIKPPIAPSPVADDDPYDLVNFGADDFRWLIKIDYWAAAKVNWLNSEAQVSSEYVYADQEQQRNILNIFEDLPKELKVEIHVLNPARALRSVIEFPHLPSDQWFSRYNDFIKLVILKEATAAAWRYISIRKPENKRSVQKEITDYINEYLINIGLKKAEDDSPSWKTLNVIARKVCEQWAAEDLRSHVFMNSTLSSDSKPWPKPEI